MDDPTPDPGDGAGRLLPCPTAPDDTVQPDLTVKRRSRHRFAPDECRHPRPLTLDEEAHKLYCQHCGQEFDPFNFLADLVSDWEKWNRQYRAARQQVVSVESRLALLRRREKLARARIRGQGVKIPFPAARHLYRSFSALQDIAVRQLGRDIARARLKQKGVDIERLGASIEALREQLKLSDDFEII